MLYPRTEYMSADKPSGELSVVNSRSDPARTNPITGDIPSSQVQEIRAGNRDTEPEENQSFTGGLVVTPIEGLTITLTICMEVMQESEPVFAISQTKSLLVDYDLASAISTREARLRVRAYTESIFFRENGNPFTPGSIFQQPDLASTLQLIAAQGAKAFYKGAIAKRLIAGLQKDGGVITLTDYDHYEVRHLSPVVDDYRGHRVVSAPLSAVAA